MRGGICVYYHTACILCMCKLKGSRYAGVTFIDLCS